MLSEPNRVLIIAGLLSREEGLFGEAEERLKESFGQVLKRSEEFPFDFTQYYEREMGSQLLRCYLAFDKLVGPDDLPRLKEFGSSCERNFVVEGKRRVNIDPGYLDVLRVVLASGKDSPHRMYIGGGIYAEIEYLFIKGSYSPLAWTYPDYKSEQAISFFNSVRKSYLEILKRSKPSG
ncbi:MAG: DUF4416 family protein [Candidatus Eisenbacteria bacterium]|nr:DUF4416 family protein [Candidatus Eisenbacteria bacterium]